ncbi:MAG: N-acetylmuramoyl-L-alanine amidase [Coriobacteriia bacterium]
MNITHRITVAAVALAVALTAPAPALAADAQTIAELTSLATSSTVEAEKASEELEEIDLRLDETHEELAEVEDTLPSTAREEFRAAAAALAAPFSHAAAERAEEIVDALDRRDELAAEIVELQDQREEAEQEAEESRESAAEVQARLEAAHVEAQRIEAERVRAENAARVRLMVDPGHGGKDPGAVSGTIYEKDISLHISAKVVSAAARQGWNVGLTRDADRFVPLDARPASAALWGATALVSIHANSYGPTPKGNMTIHRGGAGQVLGQEIMDEVAPLTAYEDIGNRHDVRGLAVLRGATVPAVIVEVLSLSAQPELEALVDSGVQTQYAEAIVKGVADFHGVAYVPPAAAEQVAVQPRVTSDAAQDAASGEATAATTPKSPTASGDDWFTRFLRTLVG